MKTVTRNYYTFSGSWFDIFEKLLEKADSSGNRRFTIWQSRTRGSQNLLILYADTIPANWQNDFGFATISEEEFLSTFKASMKSFKIHGYNEFKSKPREDYQFAV